MARRTLIDFFDDLGNISGEFLVFDDGYRSWSYSYRDTTDRARSFAARLHAEGITRGQHVVIWSENRPEWIVALYFPILPLGSFRVLPTGKATNLVVYNSASYLMHPVPLHAKQVRNGYAVTLSVAAIVAAIIYFGQ